MGFKTCRISQKTRFKRNLAASGRPSSSGLKVSLDMDQKWMKWTDHSSLSPTAVPFNSTSSLIRLRCQHREEEEEAQSPGAFDQYGSNLGSVITCRPLATNRGCPYQSRAQHPIGIGTSNHDSPDDFSQLHFQFQGLHVTDFGSDMEIDDSAEGPDPDDSESKHRRVRSVTDDNFEMLFEPIAGYS